MTRTDTEHTQRQAPNATDQWGSAEVQGPDVCACLSIGFFQKGRVVHTGLYAT